MVTLPQRRAAAEHLVKSQKLSERKACAMVDMSRGSYRYRAQERPDEEWLRKRIKRLSEARPRYGCLRIHASLRREGLPVNKKRVHRIWKDEHLQLARKRPRRRYHGPSQVTRRITRPNEVWSYDFLEDRTEKGNRLRLLTMLDVFTRECLTIEVRKSMGHQEVISTLQRVFLERGTPEYIRSDNGPEFIASRLREWLKASGCQSSYITPGSPWENGHIESFHDKLRSECLNREVFRNGQEAQVVIELWRHEYNERRPHSSLNYRTPREFAASYGNSVTATPLLRTHSPESPLL
jgi:transposase InsO family protein